MIVERGGGERTRGEASGGGAEIQSEWRSDLAKMYAIVINHNQYQLIVIRCVAVA